MNSQEELLSFLDLLDLDEEIIDNRLKAIMLRSNYTDQHLSNALHLLQYKHLINIQDKTECENAAEFDFVARLIKNINEETVGNVCKIIYTVLKLKPTKLLSYSEHLLHQIISNINLSPKCSEPETEQSKALLHLKLCDSVLDSTVTHGGKISMFFLASPLEEILSSCDEQLKIHFITTTVPKLVEGVLGYDILTRIWSHLEESGRNEKCTALKVLSSLSDYYLPVPTGTGNAKYESTLVYTNKFWDIILYGLMSDDVSLRKISVYLSKKAIDYVVSLKANFNVQMDDQILFLWDHKRSKIYKNQWDNLFILIDSLEEKQSNIVLPSLQLFDTLTEISDSWLNCAYNIGLKHDNGQVRLKCVEHRIKAKLNNDIEATVLLEAINDINFYENPNDCMILKEIITAILYVEANLIHILKAMPQAHLSPVPFYHLSDILANLHVSISNKDLNVSESIIDILKASCNIVTVREAIHMNMAQFVGKCCIDLHWKEIASIFGALQFEPWLLRRTNNALCSLICDEKLHGIDRDNFYKYVGESHSNIDIGMLYLSNHLEDLNIFIEVINNKITAIENVINRQYSNKLDCLNDVLYVMKLQHKCSMDIDQHLPKPHRTILQYIYCLLISDTIMSIEDSKSVFRNIDFMLIENLKDIIIQLYKTSVIYLQDMSSDLIKIVQSMLIVDSLSCNNYFIYNHSHEMLSLKQLFEIEIIFRKKVVSKAQSIGRLRNVFYESHCKTVCAYIKCRDDNLLPFTGHQEPQHRIDWGDDKEQNAHYAKEIVDYVEIIIECGGYGCLEWILRIMDKTFEYILYSGFHLPQFISRMWTEIEELKSTTHYLPCMMEFAKLIIHKSVIDKAEYNNIVTLYCSKIIEYGLINNAPLLYLVDNLQLSLFDEEKNNTELEASGHLVYVLSEILLFTPVPRKDLRIADNLTLEILQYISKQTCNDEYFLELRFNFVILYKAVHILSKIHNTGALLAITSFILTRIDNTFKAKLRYHGNSQLHRTLQTALQHLMYVLYLKPNVDDEGMVANWCMDILGRLPHQPSVRILLEWHICLHFYMKKVNIDDNLLQALQYQKVPLMSQFTIIYWLLKRRIANGTCKHNEFDFVMDTLLSHAMGQMFNIRLQTQYFATKLYKDRNDQKYQYIIDIVNRTLQDNSNDKSFVRLKGDYFANKFDIIGNLAPVFIYYNLPRLCEVGINESIDTEFVLDIMERISVNTKMSLNSGLREEMSNQKTVFEFVNMELKRRVDKRIQENVEPLGTIQKKYIPWKSMSDINVYNIDKKRECPSDLIVVASLIDKLPNLGGMARTSEVFGVRTYVIDSLRHLQDKQFQGLSVSAERWIDIEEVRPGQPLKDYLNRKKAEGYSIVAAEQTSSSSKLQKFSFPRKTLLLLGHEKEGVPCDLLPMMDHCVEIPQQGFVRSLNVHVTAAIFVWEYARQNIL